MINYENCYNTQHLKIEDKVYCAFCGKELKPHSAWDEYYETKYYHCDCQDAVKEKEIQDKIDNLMAEIKQLTYLQPKTVYKVGTKKVLVKR